MARFEEPTRKQEQIWNAWVRKRPPAVRTVAERFDPWSLYRMKSSGQRVTIVSFGEHEDGSVTLTVNVTGQFNFVTFDRSVFGVDPDDLEPCDLPSKNEFLGTMLSEQKDIEAFVEAARPFIVKS